MMEEVMDDTIRTPFDEGFRRYLETKGLAERTIKRHIANARDFLYYMSTHGHVADIECGEDEIPIDDKLAARAMDYLSTYFGSFLPHNAFASAQELRTAGGSVKKLYQYFSDEGIIDDHVCRDVISDIKLSMPFWMDMCSDD